MNIKKGGLGSKGVEAIKIAKEVWENNKVTLSRFFKKSPEQILKSTIANSVFATLEREKRHVTNFINRQKELLNNAANSRIIIELGGQYSNSHTMGDDPFFEKIQTSLSSTENSNDNRKVWNDLVKILNRAFPDCEVTSNLYEEEVNQREVVIEKV